MIPAGMSLGEFVQHAIVALVAMGAVGVVLRRVLGVFETRPQATSGSSAPHSGSPSCSHCAVNSAPQRSSPGQHP